MTLVAVRVAVKMGVRDHMYGNIRGGEVLFLLFPLAILFCYGYLVKLIAKSAESKGRSFAAWLFLAIFFLPLAAIIVATFAPLSEEDATTSALSSRTCPYCAEEVQVKAIKCKHCGEDISEGN